jgi:propanediol dehydratase small subunit
MSNENVSTFSGRTVSELRIEEVLAGKLTIEDFRISAETLRRQSEAAESAGYRQFAENLRRAAELTGIPNEQVLEIYNALRPGRTNHSHLMAWADRLESEYKAPLTAALVREAADVYLARGMLKSED